MSVTSTGSPAAASARITLAIVWWRSEPVGGSPLSAIVIDAPYDPAMQLDGPIGRLELPQPDQ